MRGVHAVHEQVRMGFNLKPACPEKYRAACRMENVFVRPIGFLLLNTARPVQLVFLDRHTCALAIHHARSNT